MKLLFKTIHSINKIMVIEKLKSWNLITLVLSIILWLTFYLGPIFMIALGILNIITSIKIYQKNKIVIKVYWSLVVLNLYFMYKVFYSDNIDFDMEKIIITMIISPYILSFFLTYILNKTY